ncbi:MAG: SoxR reducing system RseC family protein [Actinomycetota bacterium]|nr:SoxR reducing system RseC family protein [Actinomycetota bacterium]
MLESDFMEEIGVVKSIRGRFAIVSVPKKQGVCESCTMGTCHVSGEESEIEALNEAGAMEGQKVRVVLKSISYLKGSAIVYGLPVLCLIIGAVMGKQLLPPYFPSSDPNLLSAAGGFGLFFVSFAAVWAWSRKAEKKLEYKPVIEEILE